MPQININNKMKRLLIIVLTILSVGLAETADAQCKEQLVYQCAPSDGKATFGRAYNTKLRRENATEETGQRYAQVLNKGTRYRFNICAPEPYENQVVLTLFDSTHPEHSNPIGSTFDKNSGKDLPSFDFVCNKTAMYYISVRYKPGMGDKKGCAVGIVSYIVNKK